MPRKTKTTTNATDTAKQNVSANEIITASANQPAAASQIAAQIAAAATPASEPNSNLGEIAPKTATKKAASAKKPAAAPATTTTTKSTTKTPTKTAQKPATKTAATKPKPSAAKSKSAKKPAPKIPANPNQHALEEKARLYILRSIVLHGALSEVCDKRTYFLETLVGFLGYDKLSDDDFSSRKTEHSAIRRFATFCRRELARYEKRAARGELDTHEALRENLAFLQGLLSLADYEVRLVEFAVLGAYIPVMHDFMNVFDDVNVHNCGIVLSGVVGASAEEVSHAVGGGGILRRSGVLNPSDFSNYLSSILRFSYDGFANAMLLRGGGDELRGQFVELCADSGGLAAEDFAHLREFELLRKYIANAVKTGQRGANILLYGRAGTGKTELAKLLAREAGATLYKVRTADNGGEMTDGANRVGSYLLAQHLLDARQNVLLYDEAEDILCRAKDSGRMLYKAAINESLESNAVPTVWITNNISNVDAAIVRRFDVAVEVAIPRRRARTQIARRICGDELTPKALRFVGGERDLAPAIIERAWRVSKAIGGDSAAVCANFTQLAKNTLKASGCGRDKFEFDDIFRIGDGESGARRKKGEKIALPQSYSLDFINADYDLAAVAAGIAAHPNARLCLYGASGTGKSAFARYLARRLGRACIVKPASELLGSYVGESERRIAAAFAEARRRRAVLVFDEVDSLLRERSEAVRSWEVSQVNEMLVQMERFNGVFVATTNLASELDSASLRRFDLKLEFRPLRREQRVGLFVRECEELGLGLGAENCASAAGCAGGAAGAGGANSNLNGVGRNKCKRKSVAVCGGEVAEICGENSRGDAENFDKNSRKKAKICSENSRGETAENAQNARIFAEAIGLVERLSELTSGDFAAVRRLSRFSPLKNALDFAERLADEVRAKTLRDHAPRVGF